MLREAVRRKYTARLVKNMKNIGLDEARAGAVVDGIIRDDNKDNVAEAIGALERQITRDG